MTDNQILAGARQFLMGKDFFIDWMYNSRTLTDDKVICYTLDNTPDYMKVAQLQQLLVCSNTHL